MMGDFLVFISYVSIFQDPKKIQGPPVKKIQNLPENNLAGLPFKPKSLTSKKSLMCDFFSL